MVAVTRVMAPDQPKTIGRFFPLRIHSPELDSSFDALEMDRYSELHLMSQELMETAVQIQEVTGDINTNLEETEQVARALNRTSKQLQNQMTQIRMRPLTELTSRFPRLLRELSLDYGKQVDFKIRGGSTLIDRAILDRLNDPLIHLLRNAFDHGIETPQERLNQGKSPQGSIEIQATHRGNQTVITMTDDGRGINLDKIKAKAMLLGLSEADLAQANQNDLLELIFEPGFSTAAQVSDLSGRGVGMDIVRTQLRQIRGTVAVDTTPGTGTRFTITVPFTLSVVRVLIVEMNQLLFAIPTDAVEEMTQFDPSHTVESMGQPFLNWEGLMVPLVHLGHQFRMPPVMQQPETEASPVIDIPSILMIAQGEQLVGLCVDKYWGEQEVTVRQAEGNIPMPAGFGGCTILGDGRIAPLLDPLATLGWFESQKQSLPQTALSSGLNQTTSSPKSVPVDQPERPAVMIIDDSVNVRRFLAMTLEKAGYRVEQAKDGQQALEKLQAGIQVQAVICDIEMPRLDGYGFLSHVKNIPHCQNLPVLMLTSRSGQKHRQLAMNLGATAYFSKPFRELELLQTLRQEISVDLAQPV